MLELSQTVVADEMQIGHASHPGRSGKNNEDYYGIFSVATSGGECVVAAVADGIGGSVGGEQASWQTIAAISQFLKDQHYVATSLGQRLDQAIRLANHAVYEKSQTEPALLGMGTTIVAAALDSDRLYIVHAGDSRAYLVRGGRAYQLTLDHSWAQEAIEAGRISVEDAKTHPNRHVIRRYLGINEDVETDLRVLDPGQGKSRPARPVTVASPILTRPGDAILLCTDGLTDEVGDEEIAKIVARHAPEDAARRLIDAANAAGGADNITAVILQRGKGGSAAVAGRSRFAAYALAVLGVLLVAALGWLLASGAWWGGAASEAAPLAAPLSMAVKDDEAKEDGAVVAVVTETATAETALAPVNTPTVTVLPTATALPATATIVAATETPQAMVKRMETQTSTPVPVGGQEDLQAGTIAESAGSLTTFTPENRQLAVTQTSIVAATSTPAVRVVLSPTATAAPATPLSAPVPPTAIPAATRSPLSVATQVQGTPVELPQTPIASVDHTLGPRSITSRSPDASINVNENDPLLFEWTPDAPLQPNQVFELVFWNSTNGNQDVSRSASEASTSTTVAVVPLRTDILTPGDYQWGVWLAQDAPYQRLRFLGVGGSLHISGNGKDDKPSEDPPLK